ncbi:hypothetical protein ACOXXX_14515 [Thalassococcus sp. BH17M4-6]|uniref:hypothetical protein n=1 Tax=Thalassococcus sp. BH17M4-6 TaxID=3413148 RepID=UPI003BBE01B4
MLQPSEGARLDADRLDSLYSQLGPQGAENVVCRAMEELAFRLAHIDRMYCRNDLAEMRKTTRGLIGIAEQIGMTGLARVARDVVGCIDDGDATALAATLARLARSGEGSLMAIWDLQDLSI